MAMYGARPFELGMVWGWDWQWGSGAAPPPEQQHLSLCAYGQVRQSVPCQVAAPTQRLPKVLRGAAERGACNALWRTERTRVGPDLQAAAVHCGVCGTWGL